MQTPPQAASVRPMTIFRLLFGLMMVPQVFSLTPSIHDLANSTFVFHYPYFGWVDAYSHELIYALTAISVASALGLALGLWSRLSALVFMLAFGYLFLIDMSFYNNHYYLWCIFAFLFALNPDNGLSIIDLWRGQRERETDLRGYLPFALVVSIVYLYGGLVKVNPDWLQGYPMRMMAASRQWPAPDFIGYFMSYAGIIFDVGMAFALWRYARAWWLLLPYFGFHISNYFIFNIGEFPFVMLAAIFVYLPFQNRPLAQLWQSAQFAGWRRWTYSLFFGFQILFPLRSWLVSGNVAWHRQGYFFSWRMMLNNHQATYFQFLVDIPEQNQKYWVQFDKLLTFRQFSDTYHNPYFIWLLAQKLKSDAQKKYKAQTVHVYAKSIVSLNQHPAKPLINTDIDLAAQPYHFLQKNKFVTDF